MLMHLPTYTITLELPFKDDAHPDPVFVVTEEQLSVLTVVLVRSGYSVFRVRPNHIHSMTRTVVTPPEGMVN